MRLDTEIQKLLQKEEQKIAGILQKFKNRILIKDKAVAVYLGIQHIKLVCIIREIIEDTRELQAIINESKDEHQLYKCKLETRDLQEETIRSNGTIYLIERKSSIDIEISEKEEKSCSTKVDYLVHDKGKKNIYKSRWALYNRVKVTTTNQTKTIQGTNEDTRAQKSKDACTLMAKLQYWTTKESEISRKSRSQQGHISKCILLQYQAILEARSSTTKTPTDTGHSNIKEGNYKKQQEWPTPYQRRGRSPTKPGLIKYNSSGVYNRQRNTKTF
ncbi:32666_t:CDS:2 [Gigaspora margarita]|uniref:32666_t:CDS:1 n=1 Tax=Gigaspora margarita TaxID=4874 RepID=A0ABN7V0Q1_GIGMA|nr:32666_t:CDS:2 [Gigaspora margarita]